MARRYEFYTTVGDGPNAVSVGYSSKMRGGYLAVLFAGADGKRLEKMTGTKKTDATYHVEAAKIIVKAYAPSYPDARRVGWDDALSKIATDLRPDTLTAYTKSVRILRQTLEAERIKPATPLDITPQLANTFSRAWLTGTFKRGKAADAKEYKRKPTTMAFYIRQLSAVWEQWLPLGIVKDNPWKGIRKPTTDKTRKPVPTEEEVTAFFTYVTARYPQWERLHALLQLKAISGCRSLDICQLRSNQLVSGRVVWSADQMKQREGRAVLLPEDLFARLQSLAGPVYLWEGFRDDVAKFRPSKNRMPDGFDPKSVYWTVNNVFREFGEANPTMRHMTPHALRRRAITVTVTATQSVDATAQAIGLNPATARRYYLDSQRAFNTDDVFKKLAGTLLPKPKEG